jgi:hypothetical protein
MLPATLQFLIMMLFVVELKSRAVEKLIATYESRLLEAMAALQPDDRKDDSLVKPPIVAGATRAAA